MGFKPNSSNYWFLPGSLGFVGLITSTVIVIAGLSVRRRQESSPKGYLPTMSLHSTGSRGTLIWFRLTPRVTTGTDRFTDLVNEKQ
jgi:hypothetical protein